MILLSFGFWLASSGQAFAYIDPGTGSQVLQVVLAVLLGGIFFIKMFFKRIASFFKKLFTRKD